jgi:hypothetical protein
MTFTIRNIKKIDGIERKKWTQNNRNLSNLSSGSVIKLSNPSGAYYQAMASPSNFKTASYIQPYNSASYKGDGLGWEIMAYGAYSVKSTISYNTFNTITLQIKTYVNNVLLDNHTYQGSGSYTYNIPYNLFNGDLISSELILSNPNYTNSLTYEIIGPIPPVNDPVSNVIANFSGWTPICGIYDYRCTMIISDPTNYTSTNIYNSSLVSYTTNEWVVHTAGRLTVTTTTSITASTCGGCNGSYFLEYVLNGKTYQNTYPTGNPDTITTYIHCVTGDTLIVNAWVTPNYDYEPINFTSTFNLSLQTY